MYPDYDLGLGDNLLRVQLLLLSESPDLVFGSSNLRTKRVGFNFPTALFFSNRVTD